MNRLSLAIIIAILAVSGCQCGDEVSKQDEKKMKEGFTQGADPSKMTDTEKKGFDEFMKRQGGAPASKSGN